MELKQIETEYWQSREVLTEKDYLDIFSGARYFLSSKLKDLETEIEKLSKEITTRLKLNNVFFKDFKLFWHNCIVKHFKGSELDKLIIERNKIKRALQPIPETKSAISQADIERARLIPFERFLKIKRYFTSCPFHKEKLASFYIKNKFYYCFGCQESGDVINFVMKTQGLSFVQAVKSLN